MRSASSKNEFSKQFDNIVRGVEESLKRQESTLQQKQAVVEQHKQIYQSVRFFLFPFIPFLRNHFSWSMSSDVTTRLLRISKTNVIRMNG